jgi:hypothetical protein
MRNAPPSITNASVVPKPRRSGTDAGAFCASGELSTNVRVDATVPFAAAAGTLNWQLTPAGNVPGHENLIADAERVTPGAGVTVYTMVLPVVAPSVSVREDVDAVMENPPVYWMAGSEAVATA